MQNISHRSAILLSLMILFLAGYISTIAFGESKCKEQHMLIKNLLPQEYSERYLILIDKLPNIEYAVVCASPSPAPEKVNTPPYARVFFMELKGDQSSIFWSSELTQDVMCDKIGVNRDFPSSRVILLISSPYSGSSKQFHARIYTYEGPPHDPVQRLAISYRDGDIVMLWNKSDFGPGCLVYEPAYDMDKPEYPLFFHRYRFRVYVPVCKESYQFYLNVVTTKAYDNPDSAYREVAETLQEGLGESYRLPENLSELDEGARR